LIAPNRWQHSTWTLGTLNGTRLLFSAKNPWLLQFIGVVAIITTFLALLYFYFSIDSGLELLPIGFLCGVYEAFDPYKLVARISSTFFSCGSGSCKIVAPTWMPI
jgi:hypothetical protein